MKKIRSSPWPIVLLVAAITIFALWGVKRVPFHPDESTYLFMSSDFETLFTNPLSMAWAPEKTNDLRQHYRRMDAPLGRYIVGLGRSLVGLPALPADWDWSKNWEQNRSAGALPDERLLTAGRTAVTLLLPLSMFFIYLVGKAIGGRWTGLLAALFLGINALILLHNRRAMAEGALTTGIIFALWSFLNGEKRPWLAGIGLALAFNAKQSALALLPVGLLAVCWSVEGKRKPLKDCTRAAAQYLGVFTLLTVALNPFLWRYPLQAANSTLEGRRDLLLAQVADTARLAPGQVLDTPAKRVVVLAANLYLLPSSFYEAGNYRDQTAESEAVYMATAGHNLLRGLVGGGLFLGFTLAGLSLGVMHLRYKDPRERRTLALVLLATLLQVAALLVLIPLPWQRYVIPAVPFVCLWSAYAFNINWGYPRKDSVDNPKQVY